MQWAKAAQFCGYIVSYPSAFLRYRRRRLEGKRRNAKKKNVMDVFNTLARLRVKERLSLYSVYCALSPRRFYSPSFHSVER